MGYDIQGGLNELVKQIDPAGGFSVVLQSNTNPPFQYWLINEDPLLRSLTVSPSIGDNVLTLDDVSNIVGTTTGTAGTMLSIFENSAYEQLQVISVTGSQVTLDQGMSNLFTVTGATIVVGEKDIIHSTGTLATPVIYEYVPRNSVVPIDINYIILTIDSGNNQPDDTNFAGIATLINGFSFYKSSPTSRLNLGAYHINKDFKDRGGVTTYQEKFSAGSYSTYIIFDTRKVFDDVIRIDPSVEKICLESRDVLTGLGSMTVSILGSYTSGEL